VIAVSLFAGDPRALRDRLRLLEGRVPWVELRLDRAALDFPLREMRADFPGLRFLAAFNPLTPGVSAERARRLQAAAEAGFDALDFPLEDALPAWSAGIMRVHSFHEAQGAPTELSDVLRRALARCEPQDLIKIVAWADAAEDASRVLPLYAQAPAGRLLAFAMGPGGGGTRVWAAGFGAPFTFACWPGEETAPGQLDWRELRRLLPENCQTNAQLYGVIGRPVQHSLSPRLWSRSFRLEQPPASALYAACAAQDLGAFLHAHAGPRFAAFSITAPFKEEALRLSSSADPLAQACGAANFLLREEKGWKAFNTDGGAALDALAQVGYFPPLPLLILGAGGAARAAAAEALRRHCPVTLAARRREQAEAVAEALRPIGSVRVLDLESVDPRVFAGVIQATTLGGRSQPGNPMAGRRFCPGAAALDMVYEPAETEFLIQAAAEGARPIGGAEMLLRQMVHQYRLARGTEPPLAPLRAELCQAQRERRPNPQRALALIGPRASGKSSLGIVVSQSLGRKFVDADLALAGRHGRVLADWLRQDPAGFRAAELELLPELLAQEGIVLACGGGIVESGPARALLSQHGAVIWLHASLEEQVRRRAQDRIRPALTQLPQAEEIALIQARRLPWYRECSDRCVETDGAPEAALARMLAAVRDLALT
jgi:shikimate dehydrogenase